MFLYFPCEEKSSIRANAIVEEMAGSYVASSGISRLVCVCVYMYMRVCIMCVCVRVMCVGR